MAADYKYTTPERPKQIKSYLTELRREAQNIFCELELEPIHDRLRETALEGLRGTAKGQMLNLVEIQLEQQYQRAHFEILSAKQLIKEKCKNEFKGCLTLYKTEMNRIIREQFICNEEKDVSPDLYYLSKLVLSKFDTSLGSYSEKGLIETKIRAGFRQRLKDAMENKIHSFIEKPVKTVNIKKSVLSGKKACAFAIAIFVSIIIVSGTFVFLHKMFFPHSDQHAGNNEKSERLKLHLTGNLTDDIKIIQSYVDQRTQEMESVNQKTATKVQELAAQIKFMETQLNNRSPAPQNGEIVPGNPDQTIEARLMTKIMALIVQIHSLNLWGQVDAGKSEKEIEEFHEAEYKNILKGFETENTIPLQKQKFELGRKLNLTFTEFQTRWNTQFEKSNNFVKKYYFEELSKLNSMPSAHLQQKPNELLLQDHNKASEAAIAICVRSNIMPSSPRFILKSKLSLNQLYQEQNVANTVIAIDFGSKYTRAAVYIEGKVQMIPHFDHSGEIFDSASSYVGVETMSGFVGQSAEAVVQSSIKYQPIFYDMKGIIRELPIVRDEISNNSFTSTFSTLENGSYIKSQQSNYSVETVVSMLFTKIRMNAERFLGVPVTKYVVTILPDLNKRQREVIRKAGNLAGFLFIEVLESDKAAVFALQHKYESYHGRPRYVLVFEFGSRYWASSSVELAYDGFHRTSCQKRTTWGFQLHQNLVEYSIREFNRHNTISKDKLKGRTLRDTISRRRLFESCEKAIISLSIANATQIFVADFYDGKNLSVDLTRETFEKLNGNLFNQITNITDNLLDSCLNKRLVEDVILSGGCSNIPKVKEIVQKYASRLYLNVYSQNIEPGDIVAHGAAVYGNSLKDTLKN